MFGKLAIISAALFSVARAEEDEYEPFFLRMLASNETAPASNATAVNGTGGSTTAAPSTSAPGGGGASGTGATVTTAQPGTSAPGPTGGPGQTIAPMQLAADQVANAQIVASIMFPLPDGMTGAELATALMTDPALAAVRTTMEMTLEAALCIDQASGASIIGCSAAITAIDAVVARMLEEAKRQLLAGGAVELSFTIDLTGAPASTVGILTDGSATADGMFAMIVNNIKTQLTQGAAAAALQSELGITAADMNTHMAAKSGSLSATVVTTTTTTTTTTGAVVDDNTADTTTAGAFGQNAVFAIAMVCFSKFLF